jgi:protein-tyrosine-phosphatase
VADRPYNVLFLCTGNSVRSIMAEAILNKVGADKFRAYSAGSQPRGRLHPETLGLLRSLGYDTSSFRSKSWNEFTAGAVEFDFVFTVCDNAAAEACPLWPGQPMTAHWGGRQRRAGASLQCAADRRDPDRATFALLLTILGSVARTPAAVPYAVALYIISAFWFTASTSFANPAVTIARSITDTFAGIAPSGVIAVVCAQLVGMLAAVMLARWFWRA